MTTEDRYLAAADTIAAETYSLAETADLLGLSISTVRVYAYTGLIATLPRRPGVGVRVAPEAIDAFTRRNKETA